MTYSPKITNPAQLGTGTPDGTKYLRDDLSWNTPPGGAGGISALTGDVTASGTGSVAATIAADAVTNAKLADMAAGTLKGNNTGGAANPSDLTASQVKTLLAIAAGDVSGLGSAALVSTAAFDAAGTGAAQAASAVSTHVAAPDPHPQYALESALGTLATQNGTFSGTSSGTNTGDNAVNSLYSGLVSNATHTGDVTGATALTIANDAVTYAKMQNVSAASRLLGRGSAGGAGDVEELTIGSGLSLSGTTLSATGGTDPNGYTVIVKPTTQDVTNAGVTNDSDFSFSVTAGNSYAVEMDLFVSGNNTTADYTMDLRVDAGTLTGKGTVQNLTAAAAVQNIIITAAAAANTTAIATGAPTASLTDLVAVRVFFAFTASNTTTFRYRFGNATPTIGATSRTWKGSVMRWKGLN